jgi:hypothetical protein
MNAASRHVDVLAPRTSRGAVESFGRERDAVAEPPRGRLSESEAEDLRYLWLSYGADMGIHSSHALIERALLMLAPPRDLQRHVLIELGKKDGGRAPEERIVKLVALSQVGTRHEVRLAIAYLCRRSRRGPRIERIQTERPAVNVIEKDRTFQEQDRLDEWTGFDLKLTERGEIRMGLSLRSVPMTREERKAAIWRAEDEALERELHTISCGHGSDGGSIPDDFYGDFLGGKQRLQVERATLCLSRMTAKDVTILQVVYGRAHGKWSDAIDAVRAIVGGKQADADAAVARACNAYRKAQQAVS